MLSRLARTTLRKAVPVRSFHGSVSTADKIVLVLYPDPTTGYPPNYARDDIVSVLLPSLDPFSRTEIFVAAPTPPHLFSFLSRSPHFIHLNTISVKIAQDHRVRGWYHDTDS